MKSSNKWVIEETHLLGYYVNATPPGDSLLDRSIHAFSYADIAESAMTVLMPSSHLFHVALMLPSNRHDLVSMLICCLDQ